MLFWRIYIFALTNSLSIYLHCILCFYRYDYSLFPFTNLSISVFSSSILLLTWFPSNPPPSQTILPPNVITASSRRGCSRQIRGILRPRRCPFVHRRPRDDLQYVSRVRSHLRVFPRRWKEHRISRSNRERRRENSSHSDLPEASQALPVREYYGRQRILL